MLLPHMVDEYSFMMLQAATKMQALNGRHRGSADYH